MQLSFKKQRRTRLSEPQTLDKLGLGEPAILERLDLPEDMARRLMELGFLPGSQVTPARVAPGGGPRVYRVDGSEIALRRETAARLYIRASGRAGKSDS